MLRPDKNIGRFLISTPSRLVGELEYQGILITHAFPNLFSTIQWQSQLSEGAYSRSYLVISALIKEYKEENIVQHEPEFAPNMIVDLASLWFGKRFDIHGWIEHLGILFMPYGTELMPTRMAQLGGYNHKPRKDLEIPLNLEQLSIPIGLVSLSEPKSRLGAFWEAASFYARALRAYERDSEVAFLHLISALEIVSSQLDFSDAQLFDNEILSDLKTISEELADGTTIAQRIKSRLFQIRRRVVLSALELTNDAFFAGSESEHQPFALTKENLAMAVQAAYDVRSEYVHSGASFSVWLDPLIMQNEIQVGEPVLPESERELAKLLSKIPTFLGLERLVRFMILRFAHLKIKPLHDRLA